MQLLSRIFGTFPCLGRKSRLGAVEHRLRKETHARLVSSSFSCPGNRKTEFSEHRSCEPFESLAQPRISGFPEQNSQYLINLHAGTDCRTELVVLSESISTDTVAYRDSPKPDHKLIVDRFRQFLEQRTPVIGLTIHFASLGTKFRHGQYFPQGWTISKQSPPRCASKACPHRHTRDLISTALTARRDGVWGRFRLVLCDFSKDFPFQCSALVIAPSHFPE